MCEPVAVATASRRPRDRRRRWRVPVLFSYSPAMPPDGRLVTVPFEIRAYVSPSGAPICAHVLAYYIVVSLPSIRNRTFSACLPHAP